MKKGALQKEKNFFTKSYTQNLDVYMADKKLLLNQNFLAAFLFFAFNSF